MFFTRGYKIKDLYVARLARVTNVRGVVGTSILDSGVVYTINYDGPVGIFTIKDRVATRLSTGVKYYYSNGITYHGIIYHEQEEWFVVKANPISHHVNFKDGAKALTLPAIIKLEKLINDKCDEAERQQG